MRGACAIALLALSAAAPTPAAAQEGPDAEGIERSEQISTAERDLMVTRDRLGDRRAVLHQRLRSARLPQRYGVQPDDRPPGRLSR